MGYGFKSSMGPKIPVVNSTGVTTENRFSLDAIQNNASIDGTLANKIENLYRDKPYVDITSKIAIVGTSCTIVYACVENNIVIITIRVAATEAIPGYNEVFNITDPKLFPSINVVGSAAYYSNPADSGKIYSACIRSTGYAGVSRTSLSSTEIVQWMYPLKNY